MLGGDALHEVELVMRMDATIVTLPRRNWTKT